MGERFPVHSRLQDPGVLPCEAAPPKPWLYRHHANTMRQRTLRAEVRVLLAYYLDFFVRKVSSNLARASRRPISRTATNAARLSFPG